jgi:hypothetical protein
VDSVDSEKKFHYVKKIENTLLVAISLLNNDTLKTRIYTRWIERTRTVANHGAQLKESSSIPGGENFWVFYSFSRLLKIN